MGIARQFRKMRGSFRVGFSSTNEKKAGPVLAELESARWPVLRAPSFETCYRRLAAGIYCCTGSRAAWAIGVMAA
jgi:hypothetical protein